MVAVGGMNFNFGVGIGLSVKPSVPVEGEIGYLAGEDFHPELLDLLIIFQ